MPRTADDLVARDLASLWHPCSQMRDYQSFAPLHVVAAEGCHLRLADGRTLIDGISSWWCKSLGHGHPHLRAALIEQAKQFEHVILANTTNEPIVRLSERLLNLANGHPKSTWGDGAPAGGLDGHFGKVFYADSGSMAVEIALKMALQAQAQRGQTRRTHFASFAHGYHGETIATLSVGDCGLYAAPYKPLMFPCTKLGDLPYRTGPDDPRWLDADDAWRTMQQQLAPLADNLAAIVYEPVLQAAGGMRFYSPALLNHLRAWADAHGVYLIADEIASGMGRLGKMLATELAEKGPGTDGRGPRPENARDARPYAPAHGPWPSALPHFLCLSKGLTAGFLPLSAVLTTDAVYALFEADYLDFKAFLHSNTYTGNALAVAVANAALDVFDRENVLEHVAVHGPRLTRGLADLAADRPCLHNVRGCGKVAAVDLRTAYGTPLPPERRTGLAVYRQAIARGALLRHLGDTMYLFPPLNTPGPVIDELLAILAASVDTALSNPDQ